jgi:hypothetical protein
MRPAILVGHTGPLRKDQVARREQVPGAGAEEGDTGAAAVGVWNEDNSRPVLPRAGATKAILPAAAERPKRAGPKSRRRLITDASWPHKGEGVGGGGRGDGEGEENDGVEG